MRGASGVVYAGADETFCSTTMRPTLSFLNSTDQRDANYDTINANHLLLLALFIVSSFFLINGLRPRR